MSWAHNKKQTFKDRVSLARDDEAVKLSSSSLGATISLELAAFDAGRLLLAPSKFFPCVAFSLAPSSLKSSSGFLSEAC